MFAQMATTAAGVAVGSAVGHTLANGVSSMFGGGGRSGEAQQIEEPLNQNNQVQPQHQSSCDVDQKVFSHQLLPNHG